jgi:hypothetical protein
VSTVPAPGADTPLSALAAAVNDANAKLADLVAAVNDEGAVDQTSDDVALAAAKLGNAAAKTIEQTDVRELEQTSAKKVEGAAAAAHASAAGLVQMAAKVMGGASANDMVGEMGAAVAGANTAAVNVADAAAKLAAAGDICGSKVGLKDNLNQASVAMSGAKRGRRSGLCGQQRGSISFGKSCAGARQPGDRRLRQQRFGNWSHQCARRRKGWSGRQQPGCRPRHGVFGGCRPQSQGWESCRRGRPGRGGDGPW